MPRLTIDGRDVAVPQGATLLDAARALGLEVPTLCYLEGLPPGTSCLVCLVKLRNPDRLVPACGIKAADGMAVESETEEVHTARRTALELLLSDHVGDCLAPCQFACPAHMDIPLMLRQITSQQLREAVATVKDAIPLPAILGRICPKPCEKGCRRGGGDGAVAVCQLKRFVADVDLASGDPFVPEPVPATGRRVAIVGAGPTGLSAAYHLARLGHAVTLFDDAAQPGGRLWQETTPAELPRDVLEAEVGLILRLGIDYRPNTRVDAALLQDDLRQHHDAVLLACGKTDRGRGEALGVRMGTQGIAIDRETFQTDQPGVFAAGNATRGRGLVIRSVGDGREVARAIHGFLGSGAIPPVEKPFSSRIGRLDGDELARMTGLAGQAGRRERANGFAPGEAMEQAERCLHCDCRAVTGCKLRRYAAEYGADPHRFKGQRRALEWLAPHERIVYEPGKCIDCGLCVRIVEAAREPLGVSFVGRGFNVRIAVPFNRSLEEALGRVAAECVAACPTGALAFRETPRCLALPLVEAPAGR